MFYFRPTQLAHRQSHREGRRGSICLVLTKRKHFDKRRENKSERLRQRKEVVPSSLCRVMRAMSRPSLSVDSSPAHTHTRRKGQLNYLQNMRKAFAKNLSKILFRFSNHNWSGQLVLFSPCYGQDSQHTGEMNLSLPLLMMIREGMTWPRPLLDPSSGQARPLGRHHNNTPTLNLVNIVLLFLDIKCSTGLPV